MIEGDAVLHVGNHVGLIAGLSLPRLLQMQGQAAAETPAKAQACIFLFLEGGPSHIDMWDLKPDAPVEIRGPFKPIRTSGDSPRDMASVGIVGRACRDG